MLVNGGLMRANGEGLGEEVTVGFFGEGEGVSGLFCYV